MIDERVTDDALLLAARTDAEAFTRFYRRHAAPVLGSLVGARAIRSWAPT
jgi:hypothetical protein